MKTFIDPQLQKALNSNPGPLNVFAKFQPSANTPDNSASAAEVVKRVAKKTGQTPRYNFRDLDSVLHINANRTFINELIRQPEIVSASMVPDLGSAMIEPVERREVPESDISEPTFPHRHISSDRRRR